MSRAFRVGDRVRCIDNNNPGLVLGDIYVVSVADAGRERIRLVDVELPAFSRRFRIVEASTARPINSAFIRDRPTRAFRVGDKVKCNTITEEQYAVYPVIDRVYEIHAIFSDGEWISATYQDEVTNFLASDFELVEREYSIETLIKRANLGLNALKELSEKYPSRAKVITEDNHESLVVPGDAFWDFDRVELIDMYEVDDDNYF